MISALLRLRLIVKTFKLALCSGFPRDYAVPSPPPFVANHPFYYYVKSRENNAILLAGRLINPQGV